MVEAVVVADGDVGLGGGWRLLLRLLRSRMVVEDKRCSSGCGEAAGTGQRTGLRGPGSLCLRKY